MERLFSTVCYFLSHFCWSVNYMSQVSKFHNFFLACSGTEARCIFEGFEYCHLWKVQFQLSSTIFSFFFIWSVNYSSHFFSPFLLVSKLYELSLWFHRCPDMSLYLRAFSIAIYQKFDLYYLYLFRLFSGLQIVQFWSGNYVSYFRPF